MRWKKVVFISIFLCYVQFSNSYCLELTLFPRFSGKTVKVFIAEVKDLSLEQNIDPALVKTRLEEGLKERKSIKFQVVPAAEEADVIVETQIAGFSWSNHDPVDMLVGIGGTAMDVAVVEDYAAMEADVTVTDARSKNPLWQKRLFATVTKKPMSRTESVPLITEKFVKVFIKECFSKKKN
jgi:hypothetical protein